MIRRQHTTSWHMYSIYQLLFVFQYFPKYISFEGIYIIIPSKIIGLDDRGPTIWQEVYQYTLVIRLTQKNKWASTS